LLECPTITALVTFGTKMFNDTDMHNAWLAGGNTIAISTGEPNKNITVKFFIKHMA